MISKYILKVCDFESEKILSNYLIFDYQCSIDRILVGISPHQKGNLGRRGLGLKISAGMIPFTIHLFILQILHTPKIFR
jgi:hypothetical protein